MANKYTSKLKKTEQNNSHSYVARSSNNQTVDTRKYEIVLAKTKGYDALTKNDKEKRGRKKKKR